MFISFYPCLEKIDNANRVLFSFRTCPAGISRNRFAQLPEFLAESYKLLEG